jgi:hypothetical protein
MALSKALPIKNSKDRSETISAQALVDVESLLTVNSLLVRECLSLLGSIPLDDKSVSEGQCGTGVGSSRKRCQFANR